MKKLNSGYPRPPEPEGWSSIPSRRCYHAQSDLGAVFLSLLWCSQLPAKLAVSCDPGKMEDGRPRPSVFDILGRKQHALFQVSGHMRVRGRMWIMRHHDHGLVKVFVQPLQDFEHFSC